MTKARSNLASTMLAKWSYPSTITRITGKTQHTFPIHHVATEWWHFSNDTIYQTNIVRRSHQRCQSQLVKLRRQHPFVDVILDDPLSLGRNLLNIDRYDKTKDPDEHLEEYIMQVNLYTNDDVIPCRVFPSSLKGFTLALWHQLPPWTIDLFDTLVERFGGER